MTVPRRVLAVAAAAALSLTGCGGTKDSPDGAAGQAGIAPSPGGATNAGSLSEEFRDRFSLIAMAHTSPRTARGLPIEVETTPWDGKATGGPFSYASAPCTADAPINNVSTNLASLNTRLEGSRSPASARLHPIAFEVLSSDGGSGEMRGTVELTVCQPRFGVTPPGKPDTERERITFEYTARFTQPTQEEATWAGDFRIREATGVYEGLRGSGQIAGYFMCLGPERCAQRGGFRDAQVALIGSYDPPPGAVE